MQPWICFVSGYPSMGRSMAAHAVVNALPILSASNFAESRPARDTAGAFVLRLRAYEYAS